MIDPCIRSAPSVSPSTNWKRNCSFRHAGACAAAIATLNLFQQENLFQDRMIELGDGAYPVLFDENGDGLMDLVVTNYGYYQSNGSYTGKMALLRNLPLHKGIICVLRRLARKS